ncbi:MAG TPA: hypothetical protein DCL35_07595 [Candidatus Omnitrophica bacterium]|nr:hypothetical protein [Candidatus Omnitrophota bacterium]
MEIIGGISSDVPEGLRGLVLASAGLVTALLLIRRLFPRRRMNPLVAAAEKLGLSLQQEHDHILEHNLRDFNFSGCGRAFPKLFFVLSTLKEGVRLKVFDYNGSYFAFGLPYFLFQTMGFAEAAGVGFSRFFIAPRTLYWRLRSLFSKEDFVKEGVPVEFLRKFVLVVKKGHPRPKLSQDFFKTFLSLRVPYSLETRGNQFIFYRRGMVIPVRQIGDFLKDLASVADVLCRGVSR